MPFSQSIRTEDLLKEHSIIRAVVIRNSITVLLYCFVAIAEMAPSKYFIAEPCQGPEMLYNSQIESVLKMRIKYNLDVILHRSLPTPQPVVCSRNGSIQHEHNSIAAMFIFGALCTDTLSLPMLTIIQQSRAIYSVNVQHSH